MFFRLFIPKINPKIEDKNIKGMVIIPTFGGTSIPFKQNIIK
jgi:hypothetical protein